jgi:hypothetical protein
MLYVEARPTSGMAAMEHFWKPGIVGSAITSSFLMPASGNWKPRKEEDTRQLPASHAGYTVSPGRTLKMGFFSCNGSLAARRSARPAVAGEAAAAASSTAAAVEAASRRA